MPVVECGFVGVPGAASAQSLLSHVGPTVLIDIGFDPALISNLAQTAGGLPTGQSAQPTSGIPFPNIQNIPALIDTGASISCIDDALAQQLGLPLINQVQSAGVHGLGTLNVYLAYILIPSLGVTQTGAFIGANMAGGGQAHSALIGRSLLENMLLVYDGRSGSVKLAH